MSSEKHALEFAKKAHFFQKRKYTNEPYITHPIAVAEIVRSVPHSQEMVIAAILHDTVEDTDVTLDDIKDNFGLTVARLVAWVTDISTPFHGPRKERKALDAMHLSLAPSEAQTIKLADLIHNTSSIKDHDLGFWKIYRLEKIKLLEVMQIGDEVLYSRALKLSQSE